MYRFTLNFNLDKSPLGQRYAVSITDYDVVKHPDIYQCQCIHQAAGQLYVGPAGFSNPGRMIMGQDDGCCIVLQRASYYLTGMHTGPVDGAAEQFLEDDDPVAVVQKQAGKGLVREMPQAAGKELASRVGVFQDIFAVQLFLQVAAGHLQYRLKLGKLRLPQTMAGTELLSIGFEQRPQAAKIA